MTCHQVQKRISRFIDGFAPTSESVKIEMHLAQCDGCARKVQEMRAVISTLAVLQTQMPRPGGWERLRDQLHDTPRVKSRPPLWGWKAGLAGASALACIAVIALMLNNSSMQQTAETSTDKVADIHTSNHQIQAKRQPADTVVASGQTTTAPAALHSTALPGNTVKVSSDRRAPGGQTVATLTHSRRHSPLPQRPDPTAALARNTDEPDPEFAQSIEPGAPTVAEDVAETVSLAMEPLVVASQATDPDQLLADVNTEDWL